MYETYYVSGVPASTIPADRAVRRCSTTTCVSQTNAQDLINDLELGKISG